MDQEAGFRLPTITALASQFRLPKALLAEVVGEFRSVYASVPPEFTDSYEKIPSDWVSLKYGQTLAKYVPKVAERPKAFNDAELTKVLAQMLRETFKQLAPTSTVLGCLLSTRAEQLIRNRRGDCAIYQDPSGRTVDYAARQAAQVDADLPAFARAVADVLEQSALGLQAHAREMGFSHLRVYRGVHGPGSPTDLAAAGGDQYALRALTSWSFDRGTADTFTRQRPESSIIEADIPVGCLAFAPSPEEHEALVFPVAIDRDDRATLLHELTIISASHPHAAG